MMFLRKLYSSGSVIAIGLSLCLLNNSPTWAMEEDPWTPEKAPTRKGIDAFLERTLRVSDEEDPHLMIYNARSEMHAKANTTEHDLMSIEASTSGQHSLILNFVEICRKSHAVIMKLEPQEAEMDFFQSPQFFLECLNNESECKDNDPVNKSKIHTLAQFYYHQNAAKFFLDKGDYKRATQHFVTTDTFAPDLSLAYLEFALTHHLMDPVWVVSKKSAADCKKSATLYRKFLSVKGIEEDQYDSKNYITSTILHYYSCEFEKALAFAHKALQLPFPPWEDPKFIFKINPSRMKSHFMAMAYYHLGKYEDAFNILSQDIDNLKIEEYLCLIKICVDRKEYNNAYPIFQKFILRNQELDFTQRLPDEFTFPLLEMLQNLDGSQYNEGKNYYIEAIAKNIPSLSNKVKELRKSLSQSDKRESRTLIATAIATERKLKSKEIYENFDRIYTSVWTEASELCLSHKDFLKRLEDLAQGIETTYNNINETAIQSSTHHFEEITSSFENLRQLYDQFEVEATQVRLNIVKNQRDFLRSSKMKEEEPPVFLEGNRTNFKKEYGEKNPILKEKTRKKGDVSRSKKKPIFKKEEPSIKQHMGMLKTFSCSKTKKIWQSKDKSAFEGKAFELLGMLNAAKSMHHLRTMTLPGTQLEKLKGDREGQLSLRVNDQYRLCFTWTPGVGASDIEITKHYK